MSKKIVLKTVIIFLLILFGINISIANAAEEACKITLSSDKSIVRAGEEVTITISMSNVSISSGLIQFGAIINYPKEMFDIITIEDEELKQEYEGTDYALCDILYVGEKDEDTSITTPWNLLYIEGGQEGILGISSGDPQIANQIIGRFKLKAKEDVSSTTANISVTESAVLDSEGKEYQISDSNISLQLQESVKDNPIENEIVNNTIINNSTANNTVKSNNSNIANTDHEYAGVEDIVPVIFVIAILSLISYIKYRKYKDI